MNKSIKSSETRRQAPATKRSIQDYLVTIKCNSIRYASRHELTDVYLTTVKKLRNAEWISKICWELDSLQRLHIHTMVSTTSTPYFKRLQQPGYAVHFERILDDGYDTVYKYIHKHDQSPYAVDNIDNESYYSHVYSFIDSQA